VRPDAQVPDDEKSEQHGLARPRVPAHEDAGITYRDKFHKGVGDPNKVGVWFPFDLAVGQ